MKALVEVVLREDLQDEDGVLLPGAARHADNLLTLDLSGPGMGVLFFAERRLARARALIERPPTSVDQETVTWQRGYAHAMKQILSLQAAAQEYRDESKT